MKVCFETFGCRLNRAEALQDEAAFLADGWTVVDSHAEADLIVVRGCSVTGRAEAECKRQIAHIHRKYPAVQLSVVGCVKTDILTTPYLVPDHPDALPTRTARAYLKVQDGCNCKCTFCIVPRFRGASRSVPLNEVLDKAQRFIDAGYREIVVTGCNLALYSSDGKRFPDLMEALLNLCAAGEQPCRVRIGSLEPGKVALETVRVMAAHPNACRFLHLTIQSGSNLILTSMRRPYVMRDVDAVVREAVRLMPGIGLGCDLMTGFPGETEVDFLATRALLKRMPFSNAHVFPYSARPGTPAEFYEKAVPSELRHSRAHNLSRLISHLRRRRAREFIGREVEVIIEDEKTMRGWTSEYFACEAVGVAARESCVRVKVQSVDDKGTLKGEIV